MTWKVIRSGSENEEASTGDVLLDCSISIIVLETLILCLFFASRLRFRIQPGVELYLVPFSYLLSLGITICGIMIPTRAGGGRHVNTITAAELVAFLKMTKTVEYLRFTASALPRLAILAFYVRLFPLAYVRRISYALAGVLCVMCLASYLAATLMCRPFRFFWDRTIPGGSCGNALAYYRAFWPLSIVVDVVMLVLPLPSVWRLQTSLYQKIGVTLVFLVGSIGLVASIVRVTYVSTVDLYADPTWTATEIMISTMVEIAAYLTAACLPSLYPLIKAGYRGFKSSRPYRMLKGTVVSSKSSEPTARNASYRLNATNSKYHEEKSKRSVGGSREAAIISLSWIPERLGRAGSIDVEKEDCSESSDQTGRINHQMYKDLDLP